MPTASIPLPPLFLRTPRPRAQAPRPADGTIVATSVEDPTRFALGTITITAGGPITFNGITPTIAPQGAIYWDIYLSAPNISSASIITLKDANNGVTTLTSGTGQVKVLFPIPTGTVTNPPSTGARIRLPASNLANTGPVTISVTDPGEPVTTTPGGTFTYNILPGRPTSLYSSPADVIQGGTASGNKDLTIDGGYFWKQRPVSQRFFPGQHHPGNHPTVQASPNLGARRLDVQFPAARSTMVFPDSILSLCVPHHSAPSLSEQPLRHRFGCFSELCHESAHPRRCARGRRHKS